MLFALTLSVDEDVIKIHYHENVEFLVQDLGNVTLKRGRCIGQSERHDLVLEIAIAGPEGCLLFIAFLDPHLMISIGQIKLGETSNPT